MIFLGLFILNAIIFKTDFFPFFVFLKKSNKKYISCFILLFSPQKADIGTWSERLSVEIDEVLRKDYIEEPKRIMKDRFGKSRNSKLGTGNVLHMCLSGVLVPKFWRCAPGPKTLRASFLGTLKGNSVGVTLL